MCAPLVVSLSLKLISSFYRLINLRSFTLTSYEPRVAYCSIRKCPLPLRPLLPQVLHPQALRLQVLHPQVPHPLPGSVASLAPTSVSLGLVGSRRMITRELLLQDRLLSFVTSRLTPQNTRRFIFARKISVAVKFNKDS